MTANGGTVSGGAWTEPEVQPEFPPYIMQKPDEEQMRKNIALLMGHPSKEANHDHPSR